MAEQPVIDRFSKGEAFAEAKASAQADASRTRTPTPTPTIRILTIESDPVILSGLVTCLNRFPDLEVTAQSESVASAWQFLTNPVVEISEIDLILLGFPLDYRLKDRFSNGEASAEAKAPPTPTSLEFCQQVKARFSNLPILILCSPQDRDLTTAFQLGIEGCCLRGSSILDLVAGIRVVATGATSWAPAILAQVTIQSAAQQGNLIDRLRLASIGQIDTTLARLNTSLNPPNLAENTGILSRLDRLIITGRKRELNTARWLVKKIFPGSNLASSNLEDIRPTSQLVPSFSRLDLPAQPLFERIAFKLQSGLENLTPVALEIDILRQDKKQELFYLILNQFEGLLDELRFSQVTIEQLSAKQQTIWIDLWASILTDFFGRYHTQSIDIHHLEIIPIILQDAPIVQAEILAKIPQSINLLNYLLFKTPLTIDNTISDPGLKTSEDRACSLLENLTIQMANAVMQPLLNRFGNLESIKSGFYNRRLLSSREIERFRNDLSWRYRIDRYIGEPQAIFESQYRLFIFTNYGIDRIAIYAPRPQELSQLAGIPLVITLALETRDALSPRLKSASTFLGSSIVYLLTEIIGRGIGLIGRGVIKGIGNVWQERNRNP
jgi:DNA-binding NarL/FixJ family response regulator